MDAKDVCDAANRGPLTNVGRRESAEDREHGLGATHANQTDARLLISRGDGAHPCLPNPTRMFRGPAHLAWYGFGVPSVFHAEYGTDGPSEDSAKYWRKLACDAESKRDYQGALNILKSGIENGGEPREDLESAIEDLQIRWKADKDYRQREVRFAKLSKKPARELATPPVECRNNIRCRFFSTGIFDNSNTGVTGVAPGSLTDTSQKPRSECQTQLPGHHHNNNNSSNGNCGVAKKGPKKQDQDSSVVRSLFKSPPGTKAKNEEGGCIEQKDQMHNEGNSEKRMGVVCGKVDSGVAGRDCVSSRNKLIEGGVDPEERNQLNSVVAKGNCLFEASRRGEGGNARFLDKDKCTKKTEVAKGGGEGPSGFSNPTPNEKNVRVENLDREVEMGEHEHQDECRLEEFHASDNCKGIDMDHKIHMDPTDHMDEMIHMDRPDRMDQMDQTPAPFVCPNSEARGGMTVNKDDAGSTPYIRKRRGGLGEGGSRIESDRLSPRTREHRGMGEYEGAEVLGKSDTKDVLAWMLGNLFRASVMQIEATEERDLFRTAGMEREGSNTAGPGEFSWGTVGYNRSEDVNSGQPPLFDDHLNGRNFNEERNKQNEYNMLRLAAETTPQRFESFGGAEQAEVSPKDYGCVQDLMHATVDAVQARPPFPDLSIYPTLHSNFLTSPAAMHDHMPNSFTTMPDSTRPPPDNPASTPAQPPRLISPLFHPPVLNPGPFPGCGPVFQNASLPVCLPSMPPGHTTNEGVWYEESGGDDSGYFIERPPGLSGLGLSSEESEYCEEIGGVGEIGDVGGGDFETPPQSGYSTPTSFVRPDRGPPGLLDHPREVNVVDREVSGFGMRSPHSLGQEIAVQGDGLEVYSQVQAHCIGVNSANGIADRLPPGLVVDVDLAGRRVPASENAMRDDWGTNSRELELVLDRPITENYTTTHSMSTPNGSDAVAGSGLQTPPDLRQHLVAPPQIHSQDNRIEVHPHVNRVRGSRPYGLSQSRTYESDDNDMPPALSGFLSDSPLRGRSQDSDMSEARQAQIMMCEYALTSMLDAFGGLAMSGWGSGYTTPVRSSTPTAALPPPPPPPSPHPRVQGPVGGGGRHSHTHSHPQAHSGSFSQPASSIRHDAHRRHAVRSAGWVPSPAHVYFEPVHQWDRGRGGGRSGQGQGQGRGRGGGGRGHVRHHSGRGNNGGVHQTPVRDRRESRHSSDNRGGGGGGGYPRGSGGSWGEFEGRQGGGYPDDAHHRYHPRMDAQWHGCRDYRGAARSRRGRPWRQGEHPGLGRY